MDLLQSVDLNVSCMKHESVHLKGELLWLKFTEALWNW